MKIEREKFSFSTFLHKDVCNISKHSDEKEKKRRKKIYVKKKSFVKNLFLLKIAVKKCKKKNTKKIFCDPFEVVCEKPEKKIEEIMK